MLVSTSLGAFGPLFGSDYVYNATALDVALTALGVTFPNDQLARGQRHVMHRQTALHILTSCYLTLSALVRRQSHRGLAPAVYVQTAALMRKKYPDAMTCEQCRSKSYRDIA